MQLLASLKKILYMYLKFLKIKGGSECLELTLPKMHLILYVKIL